MFSDFGVHHAARISDGVREQPESSLFEAIFRHHRGKNPIISGENHPARHI